MRNPWRDAAKLIVGTLNAVTNGLTASPGGDRNVDMLIGGQAVIEGVMMRSLTGYTVAVRQPDGEVAITWLGWRIDVPVLNWVLMIAGGFLVTVVVFLLGILVFGPKEEPR